MRKKNEKMEKEDPVPSTSIQINEDTAEVLTPEGITSAGDDSSVVNETLGSSALNGCESLGHQQSSVTTNATPASTPTAETIFKTTRKMSSQIQGISRKTNTRAKNHRLHLRATPRMTTRESSTKQHLPASS